MKRRLSAIAICFIFVFGLHAQTRKLSNQGDVRLRKGSPSIYITFERTGQLQSAEGGEKERVWLRLRNNTRWGIRLDMGGVPSEDYGDAELFYDVLSDGELVFRSKCHVCTSNMLGPGKSLKFSVPRGDLEKGRAIRVSFSYGWEDWSDVSAGREVEHFAYFYASKLPKSSQQSK